MRFGTKVWITRGGGGTPGTPGSLRQVKGTLIGSRGHERIVRLDEDDPLDTVGWKHRGDIGRWSASAISTTASDLSVSECPECGSLGSQCCAPDCSIQRVKDVYPSGECPDCGYQIPNGAEFGDSCPNCGHVWVDTVALPKED